MADRADDPRDAGKRAKSSVDYSLGGDHCGTCVHWIEPEEEAPGEPEEDEERGRCELVQGEIGEDMWCRLFKRDMAATKK